MPEYPYQQFPSQFTPPNPGVQPPKRHRARNWGIGIAAVVVAAGVAGGAASSGSHKAARIASHAPTSSIAPVPSDDPANPPPLVGNDADPTENTGPVYVTPTVKDFTITLKILDKQCFGDAGCNITYRPVLTMNLMPADLDPSASYDITYVVRGGSSGPQTGTLIATGDQYQQPSEEFTDTPSQGTKLTVKITTVEAE